MNRYCSPLSTILIVVLLSGCTNQEAFIDAALIRAGATDFYNDEILVNLIRASNRQVFLHVDLGTLQPTVATKLSASFGGGQTFNNTSARQTSVGGSLAKGVVGIASTATQMATRPFSFSINPERDNGIQLTLQPVYGNLDNVYGYYFQYLNLKTSNSEWQTEKAIPVTYLRFDPDKIDSLRHGAQPPASKEYVAGTLRFWNGQWYYIPEEYRQKYFELCMLLLERPETAEQKTPQAQQARANKVLRSLISRPPPSSVPFF